MEMNEAAREVISLPWSGLQRNRVVLRHELGGDLPPMTGDRVQLQQAILNLLGDTSDAMRAVDDRPRELRSDVYALSYEEYWEGFRRLFEETDVIAIGEPLVRAMAGLPPLRSGCGVSTVRVTPRATTQPCVYWPGSGEPLQI